MEEYAMYLIAPSDSLPVKKYGARLRGDANTANYDNAYWASDSTAYRDYLRQVGKRLKLENHSVRGNLIFFFLKSEEDVVQQLVYKETLAYCHESPCSIRVTTEFPSIEQTSIRLSDNFMYLFNVDSTE
jgi:hypothetical protein